MNSNNPSAETVDIYFTGGDLNVPLWPTRNCDILNGSLTQTLPHWEENLLENPDGNVTKNPDGTFTFQRCTPQPNNLQLCQGNWYFKTPTILCPFTPDCRNGSTFEPDPDQKTQGSCTCATYTSQYDSIFKNYLGVHCEYSDNTTCSGSGLVHADGTCICKTGYTTPSCSCDAIIQNTHTYMITSGEFFDIPLKNKTLYISPYDELYQASPVNIGGTNIHGVLEDVAQEMTLTDGKNHYLYLNLKQTSFCAEMIFIPVMDLGYNRGARNLPIVMSKINQ
jgi:hypothetical protein